MTPPVDHDAIVVGAGPVGRFLAAELQRHGIETLLLEQRDDTAETRSRSGSAPNGRAIGLHPPALAALEACGATERILEEAARIERGAAYDRARRLATLDFSVLGARFPFAASIPQHTTERAISASGPAPLRGARVTELAPEPGVVRVSVRTGERTHERTARAVVIATGAAGRDLALPFTGLSLHEYPDRYLMSDAPAALDPRADDRTAIITLDRRGVLESFPLAGGGRRLVARITERADGRPDRTAVDALRRAVAERAGSDALAAAIGPVSPFRIRRAIVHRMRLDPAGRLFVIGDAAHEVSPIGGQGMNLGLLDAAGLAPLLAARLRRDDDLDVALRAWEHDRLASARTAARLGSLNTALGRARSRAAHAVLSAGIPAAMRTPLRRTLARAYTMGFDRAAEHSRHDRVNPGAGATGGN